MVRCAALLPSSTAQICCPCITLTTPTARHCCCRGRDPGWESILLCTGCIDLKMLESGWRAWVSRIRWTVGCSLTRGYTSVYLGLGLNPDLLHTTVFVSGMGHRPLPSRKSQSSRRTERVWSDAETDERDTRKANRRSWGERQCKARPREWGQGRGQNAHRGLYPWILKTRGLDGRRENHILAEE